MKKLYLYILSNLINLIYIKYTKPEKTLKKTNT